MSESSIVSAGKGKIVTARGSVMAFKAIAAQTDGDFSLMERTVPPRGRRPLPHRHVNCSEAFWVLDGTITFVLDGVEEPRRPGRLPAGAARRVAHLRQRRQRAGQAPRHTARRRTRISSNSKALWSRETRQPQTKNAP